MSVTRMAANSSVGSLSGVLPVAQLLEFTYPRHLDEVAIRFPEAKIVMAHLGHPFALVIESVVEDAVVKGAVFDEIERHAWAIKRLIDDERPLEEV